MTDLEVAKCMAGASTLVGGLGKAEGMAVFFNNNTELAFNLFGRWDEKDWINSLIHIRKYMQDKERVKIIIDGVDIDLLINEK